MSDERYYEIKKYRNEDIADDAAISTDKLADGANFEVKSNKVTSISAASTDQQYASAKLLFDKLALKENAGVASTLDAAILSTSKSYADALVVGLWDDRGGFNASINSYPIAGGSGLSGLILKGDIWTISVIATSGALLGYGIGSTVRSLADNPGQTPTNWSIELRDLGYVPENVSNKNTSGGYAGLTLFKLNLKNALGTVTNFFTTAATIARTWTMPDKDGTVALLSDIPGFGTGHTHAAYGDHTHSYLWNFAVQALIGLTPVLNADDGINATLTLSGNTTITLSNLVAGMSGNLTIANPATVYTLIFAGYTNKISSTILFAANQVKISGLTKIDVFSWYWDGVYLIINGTNGY